MQIHCYLKTSGEQILTGTRQCIFECRCVIFGSLFPLHKEGYSAILYWHSMLFLVSKVIILLSICQRPSMASITVVWQKLIKAEKAFWWNFHYCVDTTSNIPSRWAFYNLSSLVSAHLSSRFSKPYINMKIVVLDPFQYQGLLHFTQMIGQNNQFSAILELVFSDF